MPDWWGWAAFALLVVIVGLLTPVFGLFARRRWLSAHGPVFDCSLRSADATPGFGWMLGVARYSGDDFEWYRVFSLSLRPWLLINRTRSQAGGLRVPDAHEATFMESDQRIVTLSGVDAGVSIALPPQEMTAFLGWMEAGLPGHGFRAP